MSSDERPEVATNGSRIEIESMFGARTREPYVVLTWGDQAGQLSPTEARQHARKVLEAAEAADQDAFLVAFMTTKVGVDERSAIAMLGEFRSWRVQRDPEMEPLPEKPDVQ